VLASWKRLLLLPCALVTLGASARNEVDAAKLDCATFQELGQNRQMRVLGFLQGYGHREVPEDKVGSVAIGAGLTRVLDACVHEPYTPVFVKVKELALGDDVAARAEAGVTRPPTEITCRDYLKLNRDDRRLTVYWLDGYSRKPDPTDANQSVVALGRDPEDLAKNACSKRVQRLWWAIQGGVRSVDPAPPPS
jgi:HdeA/HdeB family